MKARDRDTNNLRGSIKVIYIHGQEWESDSINDESNLRLQINGEHQQIQELSRGNFGNQSVVQKTPNEY